MRGAELEQSHLADLHSVAAELGVPHYRLLPRERLIEEIELRGGGEAGRPTPPPPVDEAETEEVSGILDRTPQGFGFLRLQGLTPGEGDVYISASQIKRCELHPGDEVGGPARPARRGERHRALVRVERVNDREPDETLGRPPFEELTPVKPHRRVRPIEGAPEIVRAVDLLAPIALGQRVLVRAAPRSGRSTLLRGLARALADAGVPRVIALLVDERPEDVTEWQREVPEAELVAATADQEAAEHVRAAELAMAFAKRRAQAGEDSVVIIDSLSRLGRGYRNPDRAKRVFGAARQLGEEGASLTVIATVLAEQDPVAEAVATTENSLITLDADLVAAGVFPPLVAAECRVSGEEELREPGELEAVRQLRSELAGMEPAAAARALAERLQGSSRNEELLTT